MYVRASERAGVLHVSVRAVTAFTFVRLAHTAGRRDRIIFPLAEAGCSGRGGGCTHVVHGRSRMSIDPRIPATSARSTWGFHRLSRQVAGGEEGGECVDVRRLHLVLRELVRDLGWTDFFMFDNKYVNTRARV